MSRLTVLLICFILVFVECSLKTAPKYLRLLIIGDSVDRLLVNDWCSAYNANIHLETSPHPTNHSSHTVHKVFEPFNKRLRSWEIRICENYHSNIYVSMIANKHGV